MDFDAKKTMQQQKQKTKSVGKLICNATLLLTVTANAVLLISVTVNAILLLTVTVNAMLLLPVPRVL